MCARYLFHSYVINALQDALKTILYCTMFVLHKRRDFHHRLSTCTKINILLIESRSQFYVHKKLINIIDMLFLIYASKKSR